MAGVTDIPGLRAGGFALVKTGARLRREYRPRLPEPVYAVPGPGGRVLDPGRTYRGFDRDPLDPWSPEWLAMTEEELSSVEKPPEGEHAAALALHELERRGGVRDDLIVDAADAATILGLIEAPVERAVIWVREASAAAGTSPAGTVRLGFEPTLFPFSPVCDTMFFARWHGTDAEGTLFGRHFDSLNEHGLFQTAAAAAEFADFYTALDWAEQGAYAMICVALLVEPSRSRTEHP